MSDSDQHNTNGGNGSGKPEYGAMRSDYPAYNPYLYGAPDPKPAPSNPAAPNAQGMPGAQQNPQYGQQNPQYGAPQQPYQPYQPYGQQPYAPYGQNPYGQNPYGQNPYGQNPYGQPNPYQAQQNPYQQQNPYPQRPLDKASQRYGVDLDDPRQNPLYGHWDAYAILSFVFAILFSTMPILPAVMGGLAMWRTKTFRMKGFGLALAAVIINVITSLLMLWAASKGMGLEDLILQMYGYQPSTGGSTGTDVQQTMRI
ncbi:DUF4190 domain-containing protein [Bifidobacterium vespertilionis]|uniref:DUF4190 domain-containing protein n=1 Tax=Bifidobacterium vespertilionis TaxID=2562524 RepID=UPI001BDD17B9|nr:DUF4190 domain-containing protein [Bifidobacterium vespertilionis]MBT1178694.1 DUF4190 domain-containing protein [Bifidobacterium vespertilionis]